MGPVTVEDSRQMSYKYFPLKKKIRITVETDNRLCYIDGYVEKNDPDIFSKDETTQISIICPDPYFKSVEQQVTVFSGTEPNFEFPFCNDSVESNELIFGEIKNLTDRVITYDGDAECGVEILMHFVGPAENIVIYNVGTRETMTIDTTKIEKITGSKILSGDDIIINTVKGQKSITLVREGHRINILNSLYRNSDWLQLAKGDNVIGFVADEGMYNIMFKVTNNVLYEGI